MRQSIPSTRSKSIYISLLSVIVFFALFVEFVQAQPAGGGGCFAGETNIETSKGVMKIADVMTGERVRGFDESGNIVENKILTVFTVERDHYYVLKTEDSEVKATAEHPFYTCNKEYKTTEELELADCLYVLRDGELAESTVVTKDRINEPIRLYNLQVSGTNTFFANGFAVHNKNGCFLANTMIESENGGVAISALHGGDVVYGFDEAGNIVSNMVDNVLTTRRDYYFALRTTRSEVKVTAEHPFYSDSGYKTTEQLQPGDYVYILSDGKLVRDQIVSKQWVEEKVAVYNLQVSGTNTFFANGFAVHNKAGGGNPPAPSPSPSPSPPPATTTTTTTAATQTTTTTTTPPEKSLHIEILEKPTQLLTRGDKVSFKIKLTDENGAGAKGAKVLVWNKFFSQQLFETGIDGVYSAELQIPSNQTSGEDEIFFGAKRDQIEATTSIKLTFNTSLKISVVTDNSSYVQGSNIKVSGSVKNARDEIVNITKANVFFKSTVDTTGFSFSKKIVVSDGKFSYEYAISFGDPEGEWEVGVEATDENGNEGSSSTFINVNVPSETVYYQLSFISPVPNIPYKRFETVDISIYLAKADEKVFGATVTCKSPKGAAMIVSEQTNGTYAATYKLELDDPLGVWSISCQAIKVEGSKINAGGNFINIFVDPLKLDMKVRKPDNPVLTFADTAEFEVEVSYPNKEVVQSAYMESITFAVDGYRTRMKEKEPGIYSVVYKINNKDLSNATFAAIDVNENSGEARKSLFVEVTWYSYLLLYWWTASFVPIPFVVWKRRQIAAAVLPYLPKEPPLRRTRRLIRECEKELARVDVMQHDAQQKYFRRQMDEDDFKKISQEFEAKRIEYSVKVRDLNEELRRMMVDKKLQEVDKLHKTESRRRFIFS